MNNLPIECCADASASLTMDIQERRVKRGIIMIRGDVGGRGPPLSLMSEIASR